MSKTKSAASYHRTNVTALVVLAVLAVLVAVIIIQYSRSTSVPADSDGFTVLTETTTTSSGEITTYHFSDTNLLNIMPITYKSMVLNETPVTTTESVTIGTTPAELLTLRSAKDGSTIKVVQLEHKGNLFDFRGSDDFLNDLTKYVQFN